jgi:sortase A
MLLILGIVLVGIYVIAKLDSTVQSEAAVQKFESAQQSQANASAPPQVEEEESVSYALWSEKRIHAYQASLTAGFGMPLALLKLDKIQLKAPVFKGTDDLTLNRGVGLIAGTTWPGPVGNIGIAGHRDGFFRGLKDVAVGDSLQLVTPQETRTYVIDTITIVKPSDVSVLAARARPSLTLVTCYPFYFVGDAPQRYIVQASLKSPASITETRNSQTNSDTKKRKEQENGK